MLNSLLFRIYLNSPFFLKRIFANIEAVRRDCYRRFEDSSTLKIEVDFEKNLITENWNDLDNINTLLKEASHNVQYYEFLKEYKINTLQDFEKIPLLTKLIIRENREVLISKNIENVKELWHGSSSGSTIKLPDRSPQHQQ